MNGECAPRPTCGCGSGFTCAAKGNSKDRAAAGSEGSGRGLLRSMLLRRALGWKVSGPC